MLNFKLYPFADADGTGNGVATGQEGGTDTAVPAVLRTSIEAGSVQEVADEPKTGTDVEERAQKIADYMVAKKLKGISKEDIVKYKEVKDEFEQYLDSKKTADERIAEAQRKAAEALSAAEKREARASAMIAAASAGIKPEHIEDAVILAMARADDETTVEDAIAKIAQNNPSWKAGAELPKAGSNPAVDADQNTLQIKRHF